MSDDAPDTMQCEPGLARKLWQVPVEIDLIRDASLSPNALRLYLDLLSYARDRVTCFPSGGQLAEDIGVSERYVRTLLVELREHGLLAWIHARWSDGRDHNTYTLLAYSPIQSKNRMNCSSGVGGTVVHGNNTQGKYTNGIEEESDTEPQKNSAPCSFSQETKACYPSIEEAEAYASSLDYHPSWGRAWHRWTSKKEWQVNGVAIRDWRRAAKQWMKKAYAKQEEDATPPSSAAVVISFLMAEGVENAEEKGQAFFDFGELHDWTNMVSGKAWGNWRGLALYMDTYGDQIATLAEASA